MRYELRISHEADEDLFRLPAFHRKMIATAIAEILAFEPERESKARIKKLRQPAASIFRLRVGDYRVFYDVEESTVQIRRVLHKQECGELYGGGP